MGAGYFVIETEIEIDLVKLNHGEYEHFRIVRSMLNALAATGGGTF